MKGVIAANKSITYTPVMNFGVKADIHEQKRIAEKIVKDNRMMQLDTEDIGSVITEFSMISA